MRLMAAWPRRCRAAAFFLFVRTLIRLGLTADAHWVWSEYRSLLELYQRHWQWASWAALGVILSASTCCGQYQPLFFGEITREKNRHAPLCLPREK